MSDAGYCSADNINTPGPPWLIATGKLRDLEKAARDRDDAMPWASEALAAMAARLQTEDGIAAYRQRSHIAETPHGNIKHNMGFSPAVGPRQTQGRRRMEIRRRRAEPVQGHHQRPPHHPGPHPPGQPGRLPAHRPSLTPTTGVAWQAARRCPPGPDHQRRQQAAHHPAPYTRRNSRAARVRVVVTQVGWDGTMWRRMVDTAGRGDADRWEELIARALAAPPPYRPVPGSPIYHLRVGDREVLVAEHDLSGPLFDLVSAVLAVGEAP